MGGLFILVLTMDTSWPHIAFHGPAPTGYPPIPNFQCLHERRWEAMKGRLIQILLPMHVLHEALIRQDLAGDGLPGAFGMWPYARTEVYKILQAGEMRKKL